VPVNTDTAGGQQNTTQNSTAP